MYFVWAYRDERIRRFICEVIADSSGNWRPTELTNKRNADFFNLWLSKKASKKARSNFEFFLSETGIFDASSNTVRLEREDGWLEQAAIVAAQHEPDLVARDELLANPINFLRDRGWLGLLNSDDTVKIVVPPTNLLDTDLLEDESIETCPATVSQSRDWDRRPPSGASSAKGATFNLNMIARERANKSHYDLEKALADLVRKIGCAPKYNQNIDLHFEVEGHSVLVEIKSCTDRNFHTQARRGISQLLEYRFLYRDLLDPGEWMLLLMEAAPPEGKEWLVEHASSVGIILAWMDAKSEKVVTTTEIPATLTRVLSSV
ncbi:hypothetical protein BJ123_11931 [Rhodopseudomonas thermotolerans]|uniref:Uncharacterized protein n=3 Tax=Nitrobacteraceae TaxID=41294 RepID=A0A336JRW4_9BRAD|nr:hypothetical protein BJ125_11931 [Rhodopseudomonas pentothenatexigens]REF92348.1 hypothetical protein BJ123_11931 [Rhodopseudomonas thermotolerans]SSW92362.1 hypothetical protein SAMN05892882_11931 [Rhodopseudomonas pentothenatexigens]